MAQNVFQRLAQGVETRIRCERQPGVFDAPPQNFDPVQLRRIRGQILDNQAFLLPVREPVCKCFPRMDRRMVYDHHRLFRECVTQGIKTSHHHASVDGAFKQQWMQVVLTIQKPEPSDPPSLPGRQLDDALRLLPSLGNRRIKRKPRCIKIIERELAVVFLVL
jgi:hypothetical protein